jgi:hypothetical protein
MATFDTQKSDGPVIGAVPIEIMKLPRDLPLLRIGELRRLRPVPRLKTEPPDRAVELTPALSLFGRGLRAYLRNGRKSSNLSNRCQI